jgi:pimeloyl-ACP methyl ester carboxylesterase
MLRSIGPGLSRSFNVGAFDRRGHGRSADTNEPFTYEDMAEETIAFLELLDRRVHLVGHSDGANIALLVALRRPDLLKRMVVIGANYHYEGLVNFPLLQPGDPGFEQWALKYAAHAPEGIGHAAAVLAKTNEMFRTGPTLTPEDLAAIEVPTLVMAGDDDVATLEHTTSLYESIPVAQLAVIPGTSHAVLKERTKDCVHFIERFLRQKLPVVTYSPIRRASKGEFPGD